MPQPIIYQLADAIDFIERPRVNRSQAKIVLNDALASVDGIRSFQRKGTTARIRNYKLKDVLFEANTFLLYRDLNVIPETSYFLPRNTAQDLEALPANIVELSGDEDIVIVCNNVHNHYRHWMTQCIPAIDTALRQPRARNIRLVLPFLAPWQEDILGILGYGEIPRLTLQPNTFYRLPHAEYSEYVNGWTTPYVCLSTTDTAQRILERIPPTQPPASAPILFVPCSDPHFGKPGNENEITELLRGSGVHIVDLDLGFAERVALFRQARIVIGPSGQGLADAMFCQPGALLWEWISPHHRDPSFNRIAQATELDYWGDIFDNDLHPAIPGEWFIDIQLILARLPALSEHLSRPASSGYAAWRTAGKIIDELMLEFESLGDNCEFGLVQRHSGAESLGLLRFAGISLDKTIDGLKSGFQGLGNDGTVMHFLTGTLGTREYMVRESVYGIQYHTGVFEYDCTPDALDARELVRIRFLRRKLLDDLREGTKIWVWRHFEITDPARVAPLLDELRARGPNTLLWILAANEDHPSGTVERLAPDFFKGYVRRLATYETATDFDADPWYDVCEQVYNMRETTAATPAVPATAMDILARDAKTPRPEPSMQRGWFGRLRRLLGL